MCTAASLLAIVHPQDRPEVEDNRRSLQDGQLYKREFRIIAKNGQERWLREQGTIGPARAEGGRPTHSRKVICSGICCARPRTSGRVASIASTLTMFWASLAHLGS